MDSDVEDTQFAENIPSEDEEGNIEIDQKIKNITNVDNN